MSRQVVDVEEIAALRGAVKLFFSRRNGQMPPACLCATRRQVRSRGREAEVLGQCMVASGKRSLLAKLMFFELSGDDELRENAAE